MFHIELPLGIMTVHYGSGSQMAVCVPLVVLWITAGGTQRFSEKRLKLIYFSPSERFNSESLTIENNGGIVDDFEFENVLPLRG